MISGFNITDNDWEQTPQPVRTAAASLQHQLYLLNARFYVHQQQLAVAQAKIVKLERIRKSQAAEIERLQTEVVALKERLKQNSANSSLPPSSDSPFDKRKTDHKLSERRQGAQPGHQGVGRGLLNFAQVDRVVELRPISCKVCRSLLLGNDLTPARRQVSEIIAGQASVTEYCDGQEKVERKLSLLPPFLIFNSISNSNGLL